LHPLGGLPGLLLMVGQDPADHVLLAGRQIDLGRGQQRMPQHELHIGQRQLGILGQSIRRGMPQRM